MLRIAAALVLAGAVAARGETPPDAAPASDPKAVELARSVLERMGGEEAWERTRFLTWRFFGKRQHHWDRWSGDVRIESGSRLVLMNVRTREGRAFESGAEIVDLAARQEALELGHAWWVNDSYWLTMPYKLLDPGARLRHLGNASLTDGRPGQLLELTFDDGVGLTPENRYEIWVADDTGLVEQWAFYPTAGEAEPRFILPWAGWKRFGGILLATNHGEADDWEIGAPDSLPRALFEAP
ncbi:MAG: hypothetical protein ACT4PE_01265 [Candidatus Eiseniibacteriota bacterium]